MGYETGGFRIAFSNHDLCSLLDILNSILELESDDTTITSSHTSHVLHLHSLDSLTYSTNVEHTLVTILDGGGVMEDLNLGVEVLDAESVIWVLSLRLLSDWIYKARSFSNVVVLDRLSVLSDDFDVNADLA
jgi:hypothetical protein